MQILKHISIPQPCSQNWQEMTPAADGRHCAHCSKTVTDFARMSDQQIIATLSAGGNICGRFEPGQLNSVNRKSITNNLKMAGWWKRVAVAASVLWSITYFRTPTLGKPLITNHPVKNDDQPVLTPLDSLTYVTISGIVKAKDDGLPLPGVSIIVVGGNVHAISRADGSFEIKVPSGTKKLAFSFVGFERAEAKITKGKGDKYEINMDMNMSSQVMGEVVIVTTGFADNIFNRSYGNVQ